MNPVGEYQALNQPNVSRAVQISVVMPAYNASRFICEAIKSILSQTFGDFELTVVDDGSTDRTAILVQKLANADGRVRLIRQENAGIAAARNRGLSESIGEYLAIMDADDICYPRRLEKQMEYLNGHPRCVCVGAGVDFCDDSGSVYWSEPPVCDSSDILAGLLAGNGGIVRQPVCMLRAQAVRDAGGYNEKYSGSEDLDLFLRLSEIGTLVNLPDTLLKYRQHSGSTNRTKHELQRAQQLAIVEEAFRRCGKVFDEKEESKIAFWNPPTPQQFEWELAFKFRERGCWLDSMRHAIRHVVAGAHDERAMKLVASCLVGRSASSFLRWLRHGR